MRIFGCYPKLCTIKWRSTMQTETRLLDFRGQDVFVGLDVAKQSWKVSILVGTDQPHRTFTQPPQPEILAQYLRRNFPGAKYHCAYEAGFSGFWTHQALTSQGIECLVVNPADVPTTSKEKLCKTDRIDARKIARSLSTGELNAIYVPSRSAQEDRSLVRLRTAFVRKQTRCKNQIKALLQYYGINTPESAAAERHWSGKYISWLQGLTLNHSSGTTALRSLVGELLYLRDTVAQLTRQIRILAQQDSYRTNVALLNTVPGISVLIAMTLLTELISLDRFINLDNLSSFVGLVPGQHSSGESHVVTGITRRHNKSLRAMIVESAWVAVREDPALMLAFGQLSRRMPKQCAIIRIARKLLNRIRFVLKNQVPYQVRTV